MKKSLGRVGVFWLLISAVVTLYADGFSHKFTLDKKDPYVKEPIVMKLKIEQTDHSKVMLFKFDIKPSRAYKAYRLDMQEEDAHHSAKIEYIYLIYPLVSGDIKLEFDLLQMVTTDEKIAYSFSGDRDNTRGLNKRDIPIALPPLKISAKALPKDTALVGDFNLTYNIKTKDAKSYEPLPVTITIKGHGYPPILKEMLPKSESYSLFAGETQVKNIRTKDGTYSTVTYPLALSAKESFELKSMQIKAFDPKSKRSYYLTTPKANFMVKKVDRESLLDKKDRPRNLHYDWSWLRTLLGYIVAFIAGFISAKSLKWIPKSRYTPKVDRFADEVESTQSSKELLTLLMSTDATKYTKSIERLENSIYRGKKISFAAIKREILSSR